MANKSEASLAEILDVCSRFFKEMQQTCEKYKAALGGGSKTGLFSSAQKVSADGKKPKKKIYDPLKEDPNAPKKPIIQGYLLYYSDVRAQRQKDHPDLPNKDLTKIIAEEWNTLPKDKRQVYDDRSRKNREDYEKKVEEYLKTNPAMREALSKKKKKKRSTPSTQAPVAASQAIEVSDDSDDDNKNQSDDDDNINGKRPHSSSDDSSEDSDDIDSDADSPKKVKK